MPIRRRVILIRLPAFSVCLVDRLGAAQAKNVGDRIRNGKCPPVAIILQHKNFRRPAAPAQQERPQLFAGFAGHDQLIGRPAIRGNRRAPGVLKVGRIQISKCEYEGFDEMIGLWRGHIHIPNGARVGNRDHQTPLFYNRVRQLFPRADHNPQGWILA
jgi:hypothetical protein